MLRRLLAAFVLLTGLFAAAWSAQAQTVIDVTEGKIKPYPIAIPDLSLIHI